MIQETLTANRNPALTSDRWHVVHARWDGVSRTKPLFLRTIVSEHDTRETAVDASRELRATVAPTLANRTDTNRDQIFVRPPNYRSLITSERLKRRLP
jgi:hypothetical protein